MNRKLLIILIFIFVSTFLFADDFTLASRASGVQFDALVIYKDMPLFSESGDRISSQSIEPGSRITVLGGESKMHGDFLCFKIKHKDDLFYAAANRLIYKWAEIENSMIGLMALPVGGNYIDVVFFQNGTNVKAYQLRSRDTDNMIIPVSGIQYEDVTGDSIPEILAIGRGGAENLAFDYWFQVRSSGNGNDKAQLDTLAVIPEWLDGFRVADYSFIPSKTGNPIRVILEKNSQEYIGSLIVINGSYSFADMIFPCTGTIAVDLVNFRESPDLSGEKLGRLAKGNQVEIIGSTFIEETIDNDMGTWFQIRTASGRIGWIFSPYIQWTRP